jgi:hypothetical protein
LNILRGIGFWLPRTSAVLFKLFRSGCRSSARQDWTLSARLLFCDREE